MADFDYQKMNDYVSADPEVAKLREQKTAARKKIETLKTSARRHIEKMHGLYLAKTAVIEKIMVEPPTKEEEQYLEQITGQCHDCWDGDWQEASEVVFDGQLSCAMAIGNLAKQIYKLMEDINLMSGCLDTLETELQKQFREQFYKDQQEATKIEDV